MNLIFNLLIISVLILAVDCWEPFVLVLIVLHVALRPDLHTIGLYTVPVKLNM